jgi:hypothetical protein
LTHRDRATGAAILLCIAGGLAVRCLAARGSLWLDEAWSAVFAREAATPAGVMLHINHDNNHHLNTLWLQLIGSDASPMLQRALAIISGCAAIPLAAHIAGRRGRAAALIAAVGFAFAPFLVNFGSEARGYAPMLLAWLWTIGLLDRWLARPATPMPAASLAIAALLGCLAQATMIFALAAAMMWVAIERMRAIGWRRALPEGFRLFAPTMLVVLAFAALVVAAAHAAPDGFQFGNREPHDWRKWAVALDQLWTWSLGLSLSLVALAGLAVIVRDRIALVAAIITIALPMAVGILALPNSGASRYYIVAVPPVLLCAAIALPIAWQAGRFWRLLSGGIAAAFVLSASARNSVLISDLRGDPGRAIETMIRLAPHGALVSVEHPRSTAILLTAAHAYPLKITTDRCPAGRFRFIERDGAVAFPIRPILCGQSYAAIASGIPHALSGTQWRLYQAVR